MYYFLFYKIQIPLFFVIFSPMLSYYVIKADINNIIETFRLWPLFPRAECDMAVLATIPGFSPSLYLSAYFVTLFVSVVLSLVSVAGAVLKPALVEANVGQKQHPLRNYPKVAISGLTVFTVLAFFTVSTWSLTGRHGLGCSWFETFESNSGFEEQFARTLLFIGILISAIYCAFVGVSAYLANHLAKSMDKRAI